jgi:WD40 repeat protein
VWDNNGTMVASFQAHFKPVMAILYLNNYLLATGSSDMTVKIWNISQPEQLKTFSGHSSDVTCLEKISDDLIASGSYDFYIKVWNITTGQIFANLYAGGEITALKFFSNKLVSISSNYMITIWNFSKGFLLERSIQTRQYYYYYLNIYTSLKIFYTPRSLEKISDSKFAVGIRDIDIYDLTTGLLTQSLVGHTNDVNGLKLISKSVLASCSSDYSIKIWSLITGTYIKTMTPMNYYYIMKLEMINQNTLASVCYNTIQLWNINTWSLVKTIKGHQTIYNIKNVDILKEGKNLNLKNTNFKIRK